MGFFPRLYQCFHRSRTGQSGTRQDGESVKCLWLPSSFTYRSDIILFCPSTPSHFLAPDDAFLVHELPTRLRTDCTGIRVAFGPSERCNSSPTSSRTRPVAPRHPVRASSPTGSFIDLRLPNGQGVYSLLTEKS